MYAYMYAYALNTHSRNIRPSVSVYLRVQERARENVGVCVYSLCVHVYFCVCSRVRKRESVYVCICMSTRERDRESVCARACARTFVYMRVSERARGVVGCVRGCVICRLPGWWRIMNEWKVCAWACAVRGCVLFVGSLNHESWIMSDEWWMTSKESWMMRSCVTHEWIRRSCVTHEWWMMSHESWMMRSFVNDEVYWGLFEIERALQRLVFFCERALQKTGLC